MPMFHFEFVQRPDNGTGTTESADDGAWRARHTIDPELPFLRGHFPELPIVPAVAILEASHAFVRMIGGPGAQVVVSARHCKFKQPMRPGESYLIGASTPRTGIWHVTWTMLAEGALVGEPVVEVGITTRA